MAQRTGEVWCVFNAVGGRGVRLTRILRLELVKLEDLGVVEEIELAALEDLGVVVEMEEEDLGVDAGVAGKTLGVVEEGRGWMRMGRAELVGMGAAFVGVLVRGLGVALVGGLVGESVSLLLAPVGAAWWEGVALM